MGSRFYCTKLKNSEKQSVQGAREVNNFLQKTRRNEQNKAHGHRPQGVYISVNDQGGAQRNAAECRIYAFCGSLNLS